MPFADVVALWRRVPVELCLLAVGFAAWAVGLAAGLPYVPLTTTHVGLWVYVAPFCVAAAVQLVLLGVLRRRRRTSAHLLVWSIPMVAAAVHLFYQFKSWTPLINPREHDALYHRIDGALWPIRDSILVTREWLTAQIGTGVDLLYLALFALMFLVAFVTYGVYGTAAQQRRLLIGTCAALLIGGVAYWIAPAVGPFIYRPTANQLLAASQAHSLEIYRSIRSTGVVPDGYFGMSLGAMPSMHFGFAFLFFAFSRRSRFGISWWYAATIAWFLVDSVYLGWHYLVDIPGGAAVAWAAYVVAAKAIPDRVDDP